MVCNEWHHRLDVHLSKKHGMNAKEYTVKYRGAPTISEAAKETARAAQIKAGEERKIIASADMGTGEDLTSFRIGVVVLNRRTALSEQDKARIPKHDERWIPGKREKEQMECIALGISNRENIFIFGPTGCGKTTIIEEMAALLDQPCIRVQANRKLTIEDFVGQQSLSVVDNQHVTEWQDGVLTQAMRNGWWIVLDEITGAEAGILLRLQAVLEGKPLVLTENGGEIVEPHQHFRIIASDNTNGRGDNSGLYVGTNLMNEATLDRFGVVIKAEYPDAATENNILTSKGGVPKDTARKMVEVAVRVREAMSNETCYCTFSTRRLISWAAKAQQLGNVRMAAKISITNKLSPEDAKFVDGLIQRYFGGDI